MAELRTSLGPHSKPQTFWIRPATPRWSASLTGFSRSASSAWWSAASPLSWRILIFTGAKREALALRLSSICRSLPWLAGPPAGAARSTFQSAWFAVLSGLLYAISGILTQHFRKQLLPRRADLSWRSMRATVLEHLRFKRPAEANSYNVLQRLSYLAVVFVFFPLIIITGLAMSPAITSVIPQMVTVFGGYESARTLHFFLANFLVLFLLVHVAMVILAGFKTRMLAMITGRPTASRKAGPMSSPVSRRKLITGGIAAAAGVSGIAVAANIASVMASSRPIVAAFGEWARRSLTLPSTF